jgi:hypothetical protein
MLADFEGWLKEMEASYGKSTMESRRELLTEVRADEEEVVFVFDESI